MNVIVYAVIVITLSVINIVTAICHRKALKENKGLLEEQVKILYQGESVVRKKEERV